MIFNEAQRNNNSSGLKGRSINTQVDLNSLVDPQGSAMNVYGLEQPQNSRILTGHESIRGSKLKLIDMEEVKKRNETKPKNKFL